jgi:hypothetical protein
MQAITKMRAQQADQILRDAGFAGAAVPWLRRWLVQFDLAKLSGISLRLHQRASLQSCACWGSANPPPKRSRTIGWTLGCHVASTYPNSVAIPLPPLYRDEQGTWAPAPSRVEHFGARLATWPQDILESYVLCLNTDKYAAEVWASENVLPDGGRIVGHSCIKGRHMIKVEGREPIADVDESVIYIVAHLAHYWLRRTRQVPGIGGGKDASAALFACGVLEQWRSEKGAGAAAKPKQTTRPIVPGFPGSNGDQ